MYPPVVTKDPTAVEVEVQAAYLGMFPEGDNLFVPRVFGWAIECFTGHYRDYQPIDALYHDFEHTLQGTLCLARLIHARNLAGGQPAMTNKMFQLAIIAILFHDTGYLKKRDDFQGTGAKYTVTHVGRSAEFAAHVLGEKGFIPRDIQTVQHMIRCTGVNAKLSAIPFHDELEGLTGFALASADLLGQMAAEDYVAKLPILYLEFDEAARFSGDKTHFVTSFSNAKELIERTPEFWRDFVLPKLEREFLGVYRFLNQPYPDGPNFYVQRIEANMERLKERAVAVS